MYNVMTTPANYTMDWSVIGVLGGSGEFGRAISKRLITAGYTIVIGSRFPEERNLKKRDECFKDVRILSMEECITEANTLVLCIHKKYFNTLLQYQQILSGKVVIDVSNQVRRDRNESNAEYLKTMFPETCICKAFNVISAYNMENYFGYSNEATRVYVACDSAHVRHSVREMARYMGFTPTDMGRIHMSRVIEKLPMRILSGWGGSIFFGIAIFMTWLFYTIMIYYMNNKASRWDQNFLKVANGPAAFTSVTLLAVTYLAGCFASFTTLHHGNKHKLYSRWLDKWLNARKSLGLLSLFFAAMHVFLSMTIMSPSHYRKWFHKMRINVPKDFNVTYELEFYLQSYMTWNAEAMLFIGVLMFLFLCIIGVSSIPSINKSVNWKEWRFLQSGLGHICLVLSIAHSLLIGGPEWAKKDIQVTDIIQSIAFHSIIIPILTLLLRFILFMPCVWRHLRDIRQGIDREPLEDPNQEKTGSFVQRRRDKHREKEGRKEKKKRDRDTEHGDREVPRERDREVPRERDRDRDRDREPSKERERIRRDGGERESRSAPRKEGGRRTGEGRTGEGRSEGRSPRREGKPRKSDRSGERERDRERSTENP